MYVNFLSTYSDKKSCHTSTTLQTSIARFVSDSWASCTLISSQLVNHRFTAVHSLSSHGIISRQPNARLSWKTRLSIAYSVYKAPINQNISLNILIAHVLYVNLYTFNMTKLVMLNVYKLTYKTWAIKMLKIVQKDM